MIVIMYSIAYMLYICRDGCNLITLVVGIKITHRGLAEKRIYRKSGYHMCVVCVFFPSILDIKFVGRSSRGHTGGRSHRIFNPPSFCGACLDFCREKDSAIPFPRRP